MKYDLLKLHRHKTGNRVGRGISAGQGKTAGRGTKGQNSRAGSTRRLGFEGGQNPLIQRLPKLRGFHSHRAQPENVYTSQLNDTKSQVIDNKVLAEAGLVSSAYVRVKIIQKGEIKNKLTVKLQSASKGAVTEIEKSGGKFIATPRLGRVATDPSKTKSRQE